jgi:hypothetical protein
VSAAASNGLEGFVSVLTTFRVPSSLPATNTGESEIVRNCRCLVHPHFRDHVQLKVCLLGWVIESNTLRYVTSVRLLHRQPRSDSQRRKSTRRRSSTPARSAGRSALSPISTNNALEALGFRPAMLSPCSRDPYVH